MKKIKFNHLIAFLLFLLVFILFIDNLRFKSIFKNILINNYYNRAYSFDEFNNRCKCRSRRNYFDEEDYFHNVFNVGDEILNVRREFKKMNDEIKRLSFENFIDKDNFKKESFHFPRIKSDEKKFELSLKLPKNIKKDDIKVDFKNNYLILKIESKFENNNSFSSNYFSQSYYLPETKASLKDIRIDFTKNELTIIVPIIK